MIGMFGVEVTAKGSIVGAAFPQNLGSKAGAGPGKKPCPSLILISYLLCTLNFGRNG